MCLFSMRSDDKNILLKGLSGLFAQPLDIGRIASRAHGTSVVWRKLLLLDLDLRVIAGHEYGSTGFPTCQTRAISP